MIKNLFYSKLWRILALFLLSSCRTEDNLNQQNQLAEKRFNVFVPTSTSEKIDYANGFAYLMKRSDELHKSNMSGINNKTIIGTLASTGKNTSAFQDTEPYVEFNIRSEMTTEKNGDKWLVFPKVQGNKVIALVLAYLSKQETNVNYYTYGEQHVWFKQNVLVYQNALNKLQKKNILSLSASLKPMANNGVPCPPNTVPDPTGGCMRLGNIDGVTITVPGPTDSALTGPDGGPVPSSGGGSGGYGCEYYNSCYPTPPTPPKPSQEDGCSKNKSITDSEKFKANTKALDGKTPENSEYGFRMGLPIPNGNDNQFLTSKLGSKQVDLVAFPNTYGLMHSHYDGLYPMFSPEDVILFNRWVNYVYNNNQVPNPGTPIPKLDDIFLTVVTSEGTYMLRFDTSVTPTQLPNYTNDDIKALNREYEKRINEGVKVANVSGNVTYDMKGIEKSFLNFVLKEMNMPGLKLVKVAKEGSNDGNTEWSSQSGNFKENKCKQ